MYGLFFTEERGKRIQNVRYQYYRDNVFKYIHICRVCVSTKILS